MKVGGFEYTNNLSKTSLGVYHNKKAPKTLSKYYASTNYSLEAFLGKYLFASHPLGLNDIIDSKPVLWELNNFKKFESKLFNLYLEEYPEGIKRDFIKNYHQLQRNKKKELLKEHLWVKLSSKFGVISLSSDNDSLLMWPHYTQETGFMLQFDFKSLMKGGFNENRDIEYLDILPINYIKNLKSIVLDNYINTGSNDFIIPFMYSINVKDKRWKYENEWRVIVIKKAESKPMGVTSIEPGIGDLISNHFLINDEIKDWNKKIFLKNRKLLYSKESINAVVLGHHFFNKKEFDISFDTAYHIKIKMNEQSCCMLDNYKTDLLQKMLDELVYWSSEGRLYYSMIERRKQKSKYYLTRVRKKIKFNKEEQGYILMY